jgi:REP element-mobilizing transposase RayT
MAYKYAIKNPNDIYFITTSIIQWSDIFIRPDYSDIIIQSMNYCVASKGLRIHAWCLMSSHLHMLVSVEDDKPVLPDIMRDFKKFTSKKIIETIELINESRKNWLLDKFEFAGRFNPKIKDYKVWQDGYHPVACFSYDFLKQKLDYIHNNPVKAGLVWEPQHYVLSSAIDYYEQRKGRVDVVLVE